MKKLFIGIAIGVVLALGLLFVLGKQQSAVQSTPTTTTPQEQVATTTPPAPPAPAPEVAPPAETPAPEATASAPSDAPMPAPPVIPNGEAEQADSSLLAPPAAMTAELQEAMRDRVLGNPDAPVTIIEYASLSCSHCAHFATTVLPEVKKRLIDTGKAKLIFRDFPLDQYALKASMMARCLPADKYFNVIEVIFSNQDRWSKAEDPLAALAQLGNLAGMSAEAFKACTENHALETAILNAMQEAQTKYRIQSTPSFSFNNGAEELRGAQPVEKFEEVVNRLTQGK